MATTAPRSLNIRSRPTLSCTRCVDHKVRCDRKKPCSACTRHNVDCIFDPLQPPRNRDRRLSNQILTERLRHYEALLREKGIDPPKLQHTPDSEPRRSTSHTTAVSPNELQFDIPRSIEAESSRSVNKAQIIRDEERFKFVDNVLWTGMVEEFHDPQDALGDYSDDESNQEAFDDGFGFVLGNQLVTDLKSLHPSPENIHQLWQIFAENIDPLTKVLHVPTLRPAMDKAASNLGAVPRSFEALMFAIYSAAVMSLKDDECKQRLDEPREVLLSRYVTATKAALSRANFMANTSLVVLQALVIHLLAVRDIYEPRSVWSLTGVAVRIAQGMGLDRDGISLGLPLFETEMRRRIWWQLKMHDFRTAELCGLAKFQNLHTSAESPKWPTNINDDQLYPGMASLETESSTLTDAVFISLKCELLNLAADRAAKFREQGKTSSPWDLHISGSDTTEICEPFKEIEDLLETKYLRYCEPSQPLHLMVMLMARCSMNIIRFLSRHPRRWASTEQTPVSERQWVWKVCTKLLEQHNMLQTNPQLKQFAWHAPYFQQWHAIIHVLDALQSNLLVDADKAWKLIGNIYENNPNMVFDMKRPIHIAIGNLCLKAYGNREAALQSAKTRPPPVPYFIARLRQQLEDIKAKRQARYTKSSHPKDLVSGVANAPTNDQNPRLDTSVSNLSDTLEYTHVKQSTTALPAGSSQTSSASVSLEKDLFWSAYGFDDGGIGGRNDVNIDVDFMLDQDLGVEDNAIHTITWDQWGSWLAESNVQ